MRSVTLPDKKAYYKAGEAMTPHVFVDEGVRYTMRYVSENNRIATVRDNGIIDTVNIGKTKITVIVTDEYGNSVSDTCTLKVRYRWWQWIIVVLLFGWIWY